MSQPQPQLPSDRERWQEATALVHRLTSEIHDMTPAEQDFVMGVLGGPALTPEQLQCLREMADEFNV